MSSGVELPLCAPLRVIASRSGSRADDDAEVAARAEHPAARIEAPAGLNQAVNVIHLVPRPPRPVFRVFRGRIIAFGSAISFRPCVTGFPFSFSSQRSLPARRSSRRAEHNSRRQAARAAAADRARGRRRPCGGGITINDGEECPPGTTEARHLRCQAPQSPAPSILDYRPRSTVVADAAPRAEGEVPGRRRPHARHVELRRTSPSASRRWTRSTCACSSTCPAAPSPTRIKQKVDAIEREPVQGSLPRVRQRAVGRRRRPRLAGEGARRPAPVGEERRHRAKVFKELGLRNKKADGTRLAVDDPALDPVWALAGELNIPVIIHTAEPQEFFSPLDYQNERWLELNIFPDRYRPSSEYPSFEQLMKERDHMFAKHPKTRFIARALRVVRQRPEARRQAARHAAERLRSKSAAVLYEFGRQPYAAAQFFTQVPGSRDVRQGHLRGRANTRTTGASSKRTTSTSTTTATTTPSGSCMAWGCRTRC